jgi:hypothetical protein
LCILTTLHSNDPDATFHLPHGPHFVHEGGPAVFLQPDASGRRSLEQIHRRRLPGLNDTVSRSFVFPGDPAVKTDERSHPYASHHPFPQT